MIPAAISALGQTSHRRLEGGAEAAGALRYTADQPFAGLAHARLVLSAHASPLARKSGPGTRAPPAGGGYGTCRDDLGWTDSPCGT
jgi:hypothetical protein